MDTGQALAIRFARSMEAFCDGESSFVFGDWKAWQQACLREGCTIPPREFKALPAEQRRAYLTNGRETV